MMGPAQYQFIARTQIATGLAIGVAGIALAAYIPSFAPWFLPSLGILWAIGALLVARRLSMVGARSASVRGTGLIVAIAAIIRLIYLFRHAA